MADHALQWRSPLHGVALPNRIGVVSVVPVGDFARFLYQGAPDALASAFSVALPTMPMRVARAGARAALWLGPDEWLLLAPAAELAALAISLTAAARSTASSLVDVSHRQVALEVRGPGAAQLLNGGCPLDLDTSAFRVDMCTRTVLAKAEIVLWRTAPDVFHVEVSRSLAPYVAAYLCESARGM